MKKKMEKVPKYDDERDEIGANKGWEPEHRQVEHRALHPFLSDDERNAGEDADDEERQNPWCGVPGLLPLDHCERNAGEEARSEHEPQHIDAAPLAVRCLGDRHGCQYEGDDTKPQVEPEDGPPTRESHEKTADDRPEGQSETRDRGPHAERVGSRLAIGVHVPDDGQGAGLAGRGADPHDDAAGDEPVDVPRQRRHDGATTEDGHPDEHDSLAAQDVAEHSGHEHETGEGQRVAVDHPLQ